MSSLVTFLLLAAALAPSQPDAPETAPLPHRVALTVAVPANEDGAEVDASLHALLARVAASLGGSIQPRGGASPGRALLTPIKARATEDVQVLLPTGVSADEFLQALAADELCQAGREACGRHCRLLEELSPRGHWHVRLGEGRARCVVLATDLNDTASSLPPRRELRRALRYRSKEEGGRARLLLGRLFLSVGRPDFGDLDDDE